jgi:hypothetical protein
MLAEHCPVLQKTVRRHQLVISSSHVERVNGYYVVFLASESCQRGALLSMRHIGVLDLRSMELKIARSGDTTPSSPTRHETGSGNDIPLMHISMPERTGS